VKLLKKVCIFLVFLGYVYDDGWFRERKVYHIVYLLSSWYLFTIVPSTNVQMINKPLQSISMHATVNLNERLHIR